MTKEEHAKVLAALETCKTGGYRDIDGDWCKRQVFDEPAVAEATAIMRKEPPTGKESLTVPVVKQSLTTEPISDADLKQMWIDAVCEAHTHDVAEAYEIFAAALLERAR